jgi:divalent metal cation (Fe/Co/Zn/Cd) transporter
VQSAGRLISVHLGPNQIVVALEIDLTADLDGNDAETVIRSLRKNIRERHADITEVFITPSGA